MTGMGDIHWIKFHGIDGLTINGTGQIIGKGTNQKIKNGPHAALGILNCNNVIVNGLKIVSGSGKHISIVECIGVHISQLTITAPGESRNTDGIHIERSQHVEILFSTIGTGDDCISIGGGTSDVNISHINCGPGHGVSIGSLGYDNSEVAVEQIHFSFCNFYNTMNGARIKTWQGGSGFARNIIFENLNFTNVDVPTSIDQYYCNGHHDGGNKTSAVKVSDVHFVGVQGSTTEDVPIYLACSQTVACTGIVLDNVQLKSEKKMTSYCLNVQGNVVDPVTPEVTCLA
ncbi:polygalacturonase ADPG1-like protein [Cinnamomum micranthum f. kanehirae]|uniref:Polygalacturonase ADPG1-like protein n=1 Tax=Cinnamomum micranthum f. kanehirae TaxID=337451 RepID=A0A3S4N6H1_9MAGN|nr:polygalacturonase ADPG1-like protein [Cinnamomum micranthum f. kanehirae]